MADDVQERIRKLLAERGLPPEAVSKRAGLDRGYLSKLFAREGASPRGETLVRLADALETSVGFLLSGKEKDEQPQESTIDAPATHAEPFWLGGGHEMRNVSVEDVGSSREIPILGTAAGAHVRGARVITKRITGMIRCPPHLAAFTGIYAMYVDGDSMSPQFAPGDLVVVNPNKPARPGDVVVVRMRAEGDSEEATLGIYVGRENGDIMISKRRPPDSHVKLSGAHVVSVERVLTLAEILGA